MCYVPPCLDACLLNPDSLQELFPMTSIYQMRKMRHLTYPKSQGKRGTYRIDVWARMQEEAAVAQELMLGGPRDICLHNAPETS